MDYNNKNINKGFMVSINRLLIILFCIWASWPYFNYQIGSFAGILFIIMWFATTNYSWLTKRISKDLFIILIFFASFIPSIIRGTLAFGEHDPFLMLGVIFTFFIGIFINHYYMYYKKDYIALGRIAFVSITFYTFGAIQTYIGLQRYPMASRVLATGSQHPMIDFYLSSGIGGYGFIFSAIFICIAYSFYIIKKPSGVNNSFRFLCFVSVLLTGIVILKASYATSILLVIFGVIFLAFKSKNKFTNIIFFLFTTIILLIIAMFGQDFIGKQFLNLGHLLEHNQVLQNKVYEIADRLLGQGEAVNLEHRLELYKMSLVTFLQNPLFGINGPLGGSGLIGGHAGWLDIMAYNGMFTALPMFVGMILNIKKHLKYYSKSLYYDYFAINTIIFIILGFMKSNIFVYQIGIVMFLIVPSVPFLPYAFRKKTFKDNL
jgi:hypothetical protein